MAKKLVKKAAAKKAPAKPSPAKKASAKASPVKKKKVAKKAPDKAAAKASPVKKKVAKKAAEKPAVEKKKKAVKRVRAPKEVRLKAFWGVFNQSLRRVALFEFNQRKDADKKAAEMTKSGKSPHFVQPVKEQIVE
jgi:hypothetical protein